MKLRSKTDFLVIHCSATPDERSVTAETIREWHLDRGWDDIGYHFVIERDGSIAEGRELEAIGAHCQGVNSVSIGICLIGDKQFTWMQWCSLKTLVDALLDDYQLELRAVRTHSEFPSAKKQGKTCPNVSKASLYWYLSSGNLQAIRENLYLKSFESLGGKYGKSRIRAPSSKRGERGH